jgi:hypothetical protein
MLKSAAKGKGRREAFIVSYLARSCNLPILLTWLAALVDPLLTTPYSVNSARIRFGALLNERGKIGRNGNPMGVSDEFSSERGSVSTPSFVTMMGF